MLACGHPSDALVLFHRFFGVFSRVLTSGGRVRCTTGESVIISVLCVFVARSALPTRSLIAENRVKIAIINFKWCFLVFPCIVYGEKLPGKSVSGGTCRRRPARTHASLKQLSFPSVQNGNSSFEFTLSSVVGMERPGGSFECLQQHGNRHSPFLVFGSILNKMQIHEHTNEDVYEATKHHRMTLMNENHKNICTRDIKPNQNDIGKKVKVKQTRPSGSGALVQGLADEETKTVTLPPEPA